MDVLKIARAAVKTVSVLGAQQVIDNIIVATAPVGLSATSKIMTRIGGAVISAYVGDAIGTYVNNTWDTVIEGLDTMKKNADSASNDEPVIINPA